MRSLINSLEKPSGTCSLAYSGKFPFPIGLSASGTSFANSWIIDSGATDHMTHTCNNFLTYSPCSSSKKIATADGSLATIAGIGDVKISPLMTLKNVLHVPKLSTNLISIHKLTQDLYYTVIFHNNYCIFQDKDSGRMIGRAREKDGLYYLETPSQNSLPYSLSSLSLEQPSLSSIKEKIWLHHNRLGHPSFRIIKILFPSLFKGLSVEDFHCEVCELAKHKRVPFPIYNKSSSVPFYLIHSDIWDPSTIPNVSGARWFVSFIDDYTHVTWIFSLKHKSDVSTVLPNFCSMIKKSVWG